MAAPHEFLAPAAAGLVFAQGLAGLIPSLTTERLRLRAPRLSDFAVYAEIALSPEGGFLLENPTRERAWFDFMNMVACWLMRGHGLWSVEPVAGAPGQAPLGFALIGFEPGDHEPELGYMLADDARGKGYATEAAGRVLAFGFKDLGFDTLVSTIDHDNTASIRVAERLGGVRDPEAESAHDNAIQVFRYAPSCSPAPRDNGSS